MPAPPKSSALGHEWRTSLQNSTTPIVSQGVVHVWKRDSGESQCDPYIKPGLMAATLDRDEQGHLIRKAGIMGIVLTDGEVRPGDLIRVELPPEPHQVLEPV